MNKLDVLYCLPMQFLKGFVVNGISNRKQGLYKNTQNIQLIENINMFEQIIKSIVEFKSKWLNI